MSAPEGNSEFCFSESLNDARDEVEGNIASRGKTKLDISRGSLLYRNKNISHKKILI